MAALILVPSMTAADNIAIASYPSKTGYMLMADEIGAQYDIPSSEIKNIVEHESNYDPTAIGDHGLAYSCAQFHEQTFDEYESLYFNANDQHLNYDSCEDQIKLMAFMWKNYPKTKNLWSTYRKLYGTVK